MNISRETARAIRELVTSDEGPFKFASELVDELRDIANCQANSDTCRNPICYLAHALEQANEAAERELNELTAHDMQEGDKMAYCEKCESEQLHDGKGRCLTCCDRDMADHVLPEDGLADGGEPYTDEELALINKKGAN